MRKFLVLAFIFAATFTYAEDVEQSITKEKYNVFFFDKPYKRLIFEPGSPVDEPVPLEGNLGFFIRAKADAKKPFQLSVELVNGETIDFKLTPIVAENGSKYRRNSASHYSKPEGKRSRPSDKWVVDVLKSAFLQNIPVGFMEEGEPQYAEVGDTYLLPIKRYTNNLQELLIYELRSDSAKTIQPKDFWHDSVIAIQVEGDIVSPNNRPILFVLREIDNG